jgi:tRNA dimethylallyltransferase
MKIFEDIRLFLEKCQEQDKKPLIAILGPTASGKTTISIQIAKQFNGEVISADSRQIYKHMDIGTAKITEPEMEGIKHHLLDVVDPKEEFTLADFKRLALKAINEIHTRKKVPILCGGTGLYFSAIIQNYYIPRIPPQFDLRQKLAQYYEEHGAEELHKLLQEKNPQEAKKIHPHNVRYVIRALEISMVGGEQKKKTQGEPMFEVFKIGMDWPRDVLYERINRRVHEQLDSGLINEVKTLLMKGYNEKLPSMSSLGYPELIEYIKGEVSLEEATENIKKNTRNYCKRQFTWFRREKDIYWVSGEELTEYLKSL